MPIRKVAESGQPRVNSVWRYARSTVSLKSWAATARMSGCRKAGPLSGHSSTTRFTGVAASPEIRLNQTRMGSMGTSLTLRGKNQESCIGRAILEFGMGYLYPALPMPLGPAPKIESDPRLEPHRAAPV